MMTIGFLHTAEVHVATFGRLMGELAPEVRVVQVVDPQLLTDARVNGIDTALRGRIEARLRELAVQGAAVVVCTCSTIGGVAEELDGVIEVAVQRIDRAMADRAVLSGERILVVAALASTLEPTRELVRSSAEIHKKSPQIDVLHIQGAWQHFENGDNQPYWHTIAEAICVAAENYDVIVIAQASMTGAVDYCGVVAVPILSSPRLGVERAVKRVNMGFVDF